MSYGRPRTSRRRIIPHAHSCWWIRGSAIRFYCNPQLWHSVLSARVCLLRSASFVLFLCVPLLNDCSFSMNDPWSLASLFSRAACVETDPINGPQEFFVTRCSRYRVYGLIETHDWDSLTRTLGNISSVYRFGIGPNIRKRGHTRANFSFLGVGKVVLIWSTWHCYPRKELLSQDCVWVTGNQGSLLRRLAPKEGASHPFLPQKGSDKK